MSNLRDLAKKIEQVAHEHPCYSQAMPAVSHLVDHLCAMARCEEANRELQMLRIELDKAITSRAIISNTRRR